MTHRYYDFLVQSGISGSHVTQGQVDTLWRYLSAEAREFADIKNGIEGTEGTAAAATATAATAAATTSS